MLELFPHALYAAILAVVGLAAGLALVPYAARRTVVQPLEIAVEDEVRLLVGVLSDLRRLPYLTTLVPSDFAAGANSRIWAGLLEIADPELSRLSADPGDEECALLGAELVERAASVHAELAARLSAAPTASVDLERLRYLSDLSVSGPPTDDDVLDAGQAVMLTGTDRTRLGGSGLVVPSRTPDSVDPQSPPIRRDLGTPTRLRRVLTAAAAAGAAALLYGFVAAAGLSGVSLWLGVGALGVLLGGSVVITLVDLDTLYVDLRVFLVTAVLGWSLTIAAVGVAGEWSRLIPGVVVVSATAVLFEVVNRLHRWRRGMDGQGFGDTLIVLVTAGIPPALTGDWTLGYYSVMAGMATCVVGWLIGFARGKLSRSSPMAFGPYLAAGWVLGWATYLLIG